MLYGHLDKQPWMDGWREGLSATKPVMEGKYLYGRGGADDGYSLFSCMLAIKNAHLQGVPTPRCVMVLESEEESGSGSLVSLLKSAKAEIGQPDVCFCMDSGCFDFEKLWIVSSLRGITIGNLTVEAGTQNYHSGLVGGIIPETFRVACELLSRVDDSKTGKVCKELQTQIPTWAVKEAKLMSGMQGKKMYTNFNVCKGLKFIN